MQGVLEDLLESIWVYALVLGDVYGFVRLLFSPFLPHAVDNEAAADDFPAFPALAMTAGSLTI